MKSMTVRMLKDWSFHKRGQLATVYEPTAKNWVNTGIAELVESRDLPVEAAVASPAREEEHVERAEARPKRRGKRP